MKHRRKTVLLFLCAFCVLFSCVPAHAANSYRDVRVGVSGQMAPLLYITEDGTPAGLYVDIMNELARVGDMNVEYAVYDRQNQAIHALTEGEVDAVLGVVEEDFASFPDVRATSEIYSASICLVMSDEDAQRMRQEALTYPLKAAYELGTVTYSQVSQLNARQIRIVGTQEALYEELVRGDSNAVMAVKDCAQYMLRRDGLAGSYTIALNYVSSVSYNIAVRRSDRLRFNALNGSINALRSSSDYGKIIDRWIVDPDLADAQSRIQDLTHILTIVFWAALAVLAILFLFNLSLRRLVDQRTQELNDKVADLENAYTLRNNLVEHASAANLVVRLDGTILLMNDVARRMEGIPIEQPDLPNIEELPVIGEAWERSPADMDQPELLVLRDEEGKRHTYRYQCHRTSVADERVFIIEDVTDEEQERQEIFEEGKNRALNRIISGIAHEIKNPLTTIKNYASLAKEQGDDPEFQEAFQEYVPKEVDRISKMIETLINYSRPPKGQKELFEAALLVDDVLDLVYLTAKKNVPIQTDLDRSIKLYANREQLRQTLVNLLLNSTESVRSKVEAGEAAEDQTIRVSVYRRGGEAAIEVYDTGIGMSEEQVAQCTDPFFTTKKTGTGMGLAMSKLYVRENDGRLEVESVQGSYTVMRMLFTENGGGHAETADLDRG